MGGFLSVNRVAQWKRAVPITQRSEDQNLALLFCSFFAFTSVALVVRVKLLIHLSEKRCPRCLYFLLINEIAFRKNLQTCQCKKNIFLPFVN